MASGLNMFTNWTLKTFTKDGAWKTLDLSGDLVAGATGVVIFVKGTTAQRTIGVRKTGSTDTILFELEAGTDDTQDMLFVGVDGSRQVDVNASGASDWYVAGEIDSNGSFNTNAVDESSTTSGAWQTRNPTNLTTDPVAAFILIDSISSGNTQVHTRMTGSTDARQANADLRLETGRGVIVGLDGNGDFDTYNEHATLRHTLWYMGDINAGLTMKTNGVDKSVDSPLSTWTDQDLTGDTASDADAAFFEGQRTGSGGFRQFWFRENGSTDDFSAGTDQRLVDTFLAAVGLDSSQIHEWWSEEAGNDWWLIGYASPIAAGGIAMPLVMLQHDQLAGGVRANA